MRSFQRTGQVWLFVVLAVLWVIIGCQRAKQPAASTTTSEPVAVAEIGEEPAQQPEPPKQPERPDEQVATPTPSGGGDVAETDPSEQVALAGEVGLGKLVPIQIELPAPAFRGTPVPGKEPNVEKPRERPREPFLAPEGTVNLARGRPVACSDPMPASGEVDYVTDADKEASDFGYLELRPGTEWVQIDLGRKATIYAVLIWHNHAEARVYRDVIVQVSDDPDFLDARTVFNNDYDGSSGMGVGDRMGYVETSEGKLIDCRGVEGRYVRLYSKGNHIDDKNHYTEVEVFGRPAA